MVHGIYEAYLAAERHYDIDLQARLLRTALRDGLLESGTALAQWLAGRYRVLFLAGIMAVDKKRPQKALVHFRTFEELTDKLMDRSFVFAFLWEGWAYMQLRDYQKARDKFSDYLEFYPQNDVAHFQLGNAYARLGDMGAALDEYAAALAIRKDFKECYINAGQIARRIGDNTTAQAFAAAAASGIETLGDGELLEDANGYTLRIPEMDWRDVPIFINARDRLIYLQKQIGWLLNAGHRRVYILDNDSTYPKLLDYYRDLASEKRVQVIPLGKNYGHTAVWDSGILETLDIRTPYVYTDPDIVPAEACPDNLVEKLLDVLREYPFLYKAGPALKTDDITYAYRTRTGAWENLWYLHPVRDELYFSTIDTTFAVYRNLRHYAMDVDMRLTGKWYARHLPWYCDTANLPEDEAYYVAHSSLCSTFVNDLQTTTETSSET